MAVWRQRLTKTLPWITGTLVFVQLLSLRLGLLDCFFFDSVHADVQGIDYYSLPKAFLNLAAGRSAYDTFGPPAYGPHFTWYLAHPALAALLGSWLSLWPPETGYGVFALLSLTLMAICAWLLAGLSANALTRRLVWLLLLGSFPGYWMLYTGNVQALLVLALTMTFRAVCQLANRQTEPGHAQSLLLAGLLLSLLTKPVVLLMLPLLLLMPETRKSTLRALAAYAVVSLLFECVPALNPEAVGLPRVAWLAVHPGYVHRTMDIYANRFVLTPEMKDNSIHWFNLIAQSGYRFMHIDIFSLPVFLDTLLGARTPDWLYQLPLGMVLGLTIAVSHLRNTTARLHAALLLVLAISLTFFLAYPTVWEYQYTSVLPVAAILLLLRNGVSPSVALWQRTSMNWMLALASCAWLPSLYFLLEGRPADAATLTWIRFDRVVPVTLLFLWMAVTVLRLALAPQTAPYSNKSQRTHS